jgi:hypothetical protein
MGTANDFARPELIKLPTTFRLPKAGARDPFFGLSRAWFYSAEAHGLIRLIRLRDKGKTRGTTLVMTEQVLELIHNQQN